MWLERGVAACIPIPHPYQPVCKCNAAPAAASYFLCLDFHRLLFAFMHYVAACVYSSPTCCLASPPSVRPLVHIPKQVHLSSTMGKGVPVELATVDPSSPRFMLIDEDAETTVKKALEAELAREGQRSEDVRERASL